MFGIAAFARLVLLIACPFLHVPAPATDDPPAVLAGTVLREDGTPVVGATVRCLRTSQRLLGGCRCGEPDWASVLPCSIDRVVTDGHGRFRFEFPGGLALNRVQVMPTAETGVALVSWASPSHQSRDEIGPGESIEVIVQAPRPTCLRGTVVDAGGAVVPSARVLVWHAGRPCDLARSPIPPDAIVSAAADGSFVVPATGSRTLLEAEADGMVANDRLIAASEPGSTREGLQLTLQRAGDVEGILLDPAGTPLADKTVVAQRWSPGGEWECVSGIDVMRSTSFSLVVRTDASGHFTLRRLPQEALDVQANVAPFLPWSCTLVPAGQSLRIALDAGVVLRGTVRSAEGGPVKGAYMETTAAGGYIQITDAQGAFTFVGVPPSPVALLSVRADGFAGRYIDDLVIVAGRDNVLDLELTPERFVTGCVVDGEGKPFANREIYARGDECLATQPERDRIWLREGFTLASPGTMLGASQTYTDDDGHFRLGQLVPGAYLLRVGDPPQLFRVAAGDHDVVIQLAQHDAWRRRLLGRVIDADTGQPIHGFQVTGQYNVLGPRAPDPLQVSGDAFVFDLYTGCTVVTVSAPGYLRWKQMFDGDEVRDYEMNIPLQPARSVTVKVVDSKGQPVRSVLTIVCRGAPVPFDADARPTSGSAKTGREGMLLVERLPPDVLEFHVTPCEPDKPGSTCTRVVDLRTATGTEILEFVVTSD